MSRPCAARSRSRQTAMFRRSDDDVAPISKPRRSASARVAWVLLIGAGAVVLTRASAATIVQVHGDGMAPTILDGESVVMIRGTWGIEPGDIVVYDPTPPAEPPEPEAEPPRPLPRSTPGKSDQGRTIEPERRARGQLRNTAVVEVDEVEANWEQVQGGKHDRRPRGYRVGRVLACPGDTVTFHVPDVPLGLLVDGSPIAQKPGDRIRIALAGKPRPGEIAGREPRMRETAWETLGDSRYPILAGTMPMDWTGIGLPDDMGPIEIHAEGFLVLADNRDEGACCDSRVLGWIAPQNVRGEVVLRLAGDPGAMPDGDPSARAMQWLP